MTGVRNYAFPQIYDIICITFVDADKKVFMNSLIEKLEVYTDR